jgi:membrane protease YdiL (CAAX protease family)
MIGVVSIKEISGMGNARRHMNHIGVALLALMLLQRSVSLTVYYIIARSDVTGIEFYGLSYVGILKTIAQIKSAAAGNALAMPLALLFATLIGNIVPFIVCARAVDVNKRKVFSCEKVSGSMTAIYGIVALGAGLFASMVVNLIARLLKPVGLELAMPSISIPWGSPVGVVIMVLAVVVAAPLTEEFICRGVLLNVFRRFGDVFAVVASSLVWALLHGNFVQGVPVFAMGLFLGALALRANSIIPTVILHGINNMLALVEATAASQNKVFSTTGVPMINFIVLISAIVLVGVCYKPFDGLRRDGNIRCGGNIRGFAVFFSCVPMIVAILICATMTVLSIKPV